MDSQGARSEHYVSEIDRDGVILATGGPTSHRSVVDLVGTDVRQWIAPFARAAFARALSEAFAAAEPRSFEWTGIDSGWSFESRITPVWRDGAIVHAVMTTQDITERKREQAALRESEQRFQALVQGGFEGLQISAGGKILVANEVLARMLGCRVEDLVGKSGLDFCTPESRAAVLEHLRSGSEAPYENVAVRTDGSTFPVEILGRNIQYLGAPARLTAFRDLTERRRLEREQSELQQQMGQAQKLESLGMLAGGIAHDFNNVLMAVLANAEIAQHASDLPSVVEARLNDIGSAAMRGRELTRQLLNYAAQGPLTREPVELNDLVRDTVALLVVSTSKKAELSLQLSESLAMVEGDPAQLRQLVMNLVINASEALADQPGRIEVSIAPGQVTQAELARSALQAEIPSGRAVVLRVSDTGQGMDPETQKRIFEPFFTTKATGRGLGLASVLNIVRGHRGGIWIDSEVGRGTKFTVWLKQSERFASLPAPAPADERIAMRKARGLALVVDDEAMLLNLARETLAHLGFEVLTASDGLAAWDAFVSQQERLTLVLLDLTMPKLSGIEVLRRIRAGGARVPVLCTSGYSAELLDAELSNDSQTRFLAKPYSLAELESGIAELLPAGDLER